MSITFGTGSIGAGAVIVDDNHIFTGADITACETARDTYFGLNPEELIEGVQIVLDPTAGEVQLQERRSAAWQDITTVVRGPSGVDGSGAVDDTAYGVSWDGITTVAASKNAVYDKITAMDSAIALNTAKVSYTDASIVAENTADITDIRTLTGTNDESTHLGTFSGGTISDNVSVKTGMQELESALEGSATVHSDITSTGSGSIITTSEREYITRDSSFASVTNPAQDAAVTTGIVDVNAGVIITTSVSSNSQTIATPTDLSEKSFLVGVSSGSTNAVNVNGTNIQVGQVVEFVWDGSAWINDPTQNALLSTQSTGWVSGCAITINANTTSYDVSAGVVRVVDSHTDTNNPVFKTVPFAGVTAKAPANIATTPITAIAIDSSGSIVESNTGFVGEAVRDNAVIGSVGHPNLVNVTTVNSFTTAPNFNIASSLNDLGEAIGTINESGNIVSANGVNLNLNLSAGSIFRFGVNTKDNAKLPNTISGSPLVAFSWFYTWQDGVGGFNLSPLTSSIVPNRYDDGTGGIGQPNGVVANNNWSVHRVYVERSSGTQAIQYGAATYATEADAVASLKSEAFNANPSLRGFVLRAWVIVKGNATDLSDTGQAVIINAGKFGDESASGATTATTTMQSAYNNSEPNPEIVTNASGGAVTIRRGSATDTDNVLEVQNNAGTITHAITGEGKTSIANDLAVDTNVLFVDTTNDRVGVNNATPSFKLDVIGDIHTTTDLRLDDGRFLSWGDASTRIEGSGATDYIAFLTDAGQERMRVNTGGNVGIGTATPTSKLSVRSTTRDSQIQISADDERAGGFLTSDSVFTDDNAFLSGGVEYVNQDWIARSTTGWVMGGSGGTMGFYTVTGATLGNTATLDNRLIITNDGDIGIGISPSHFFHVERDVNEVVRGTIRNANAGVGASAQWRVENDVSAVANIQIHSSASTVSRWGQTLNNWAEVAGGAVNGMAVGTTGTVPLILGTNSLERIRIISDGKVGIGTNTPTANLTVATPSATGTEDALILVNSSNSEFLRLRRDGSTARMESASTLILGADYDNNSVGSDSLIVFENNGTESARFDSVGRFVAKKQLNLDAPTELTIATGVITVTKSFHTVDTEADGATDDLTSILGGSAGDILILTSNTTGRTVVVKDAGTLRLSGGDFTMNDNDDVLTLINVGADTWLEVSRSNNA